MTTQDQALLFQCQKWHLREIEHARADANMHAEIAKSRGMPRKGAEISRRMQAKALARVRLHAAFADALTSVVSKPIAK